LILQSRRTTVPRYRQCRDENPRAHLRWWGPSRHFAALRIWSLSRYSGHGVGRSASPVTATADFLAPDILNRCGSAVPAQTHALHRTLTTDCVGTAILRRSPPAVADITPSPRHGASHQRGVSDKSKHAMETPDRLLDPCRTPAQRTAILPRWRDHDALQHGWWILPVSDRGGSITGAIKVAPDTGQGIKSAHPLHSSQS